VYLFEANWKKKFSSLHAMMTFSAALRSNNNFRPLFLNAPRCGEDSDSNNRRRRRRRRRRGEGDVTKSGGGGSGGGDTKRRDFLLLSSSSFVALTTTTTISTTLFDYSSSRAEAKAATEGGGGGGGNNDDADEFQSPLVKALLKQTEENKSLRKLQMETKYCLRQSQLGVGDCADIDEETILKIQKERAEKLKMKEKEGTERETDD
jgi:hypothetical protein